MSEPWENIRALSPEDLQTQLEASGIPEEVWETIIAYYTQERNHAARCGLSELLRNLEAEPAGSGQGQYIIQNICSIMTIRYEADGLSMFQLLGEAFTLDQRLTVCSHLLELSGIRFPGSGPSCPELRQPEMQQAALKTMLYYGHITLYGKPDRHDVFATVMFKKLTNLYDYLKRLCENSAVQGMAGIQPTAISLSGSDAHNRGRQVVYLERNISGQWVKDCVIKPHDVRMERAATLAIAAISGMMSAQDRLPQLQLSCWAPPEAWGQAVFLHRHGVKTPDEAKRYFRQMGALIYITKLLGLGDAHQDNIFSTQNGPVVIDSEVVFDPWIIQSRNLFSTCTNSALSESTVNEVPARAANNSFTVNGECSASLLYRSDYAEEVKQGFLNALLACMKNEDTLLSRLEAYYKSISKIRMVPLATAEFPEIAMEYYFTGDLDPTKRPFASLVNNLKADRVDMPYAEWIERLKNAIFKSFDEGDIPYFKFVGQDNDAKIGYVSCNGVNLSRADDLLRKPFQAALAENISFLASNSAQVQLRDFLRL